MTKMIFNNPNQLLSHFPPLHSGAMHVFHSRVFSRPFTPTREYYSEQMANNADSGLHNVKFTLSNPALSLYLINIVAYWQPELIVGRLR